MKVTAERPAPTPPPLKSVTIELSPHEVRWLVEGISYLLDSDVKRDNAPTTVKLLEMLKNELGK